MLHDHLEKPPKTIVLSVNENNSVLHDHLEKPPKTIEVEENSLPKSSAKLGETVDGWRKSTGVIEQNYDMFRIESDSNT